MTQHYELIVTDASPLITLAAADALDLLVIPKMSVIIPDMVYYEVTRDLAKLGANSLISWAKQNHGLVRIEPTQVFAEYQTLLRIDPATPSRGRGERSAAEVLEDAIANDPDLVAFLLYEDSDINRRRFVDLLPERVLPIATGVYLHELEVAGKIQSADHVLDEAKAKGRDVRKQFVAVTTKEISTALQTRLAPKKGGPER